MKKARLLTEEVEAIIETGERSTLHSRALQLQLHRVVTSLEFWQRVLASTGVAVWKTRVAVGPDIHRLGRVWSEEGCRTHERTVGATYAIGLELN